ncbi:MAG: M1 family metallopeptidase, partial [Bacteroidia bacterium]|nr:M1 family metallopeptidase [Bacteroidia bacterium]
MCGWWAIATSVSAWGQNYFQQQTDYIIRVRLDDQKHRLTATEEIRYTNNSSDVLKEMYFHLWPNAYSSKRTAWAKQMVENGKSEFHFAPKSQRGYIAGLDFKVDGRPVKWQKDPFNPDVARLDLADYPIAPGQTVVVSTPFEVQIPASFSRLGRVGQQYQITQWYPKPAVYDRFGWHPMPYLDQGEFYSEFGTFDVYIDIPSEYVVGATGDLQFDTPDAAKEVEFLRERERLSRQLLSRTLPKDSLPFPTKTLDGRKVLHFRQDRCHDFAWFCDKQYYVLTSSMNLPESGRTVKLVAMFNDKHKKNWAAATDYLRDAIYYYSTWVGEYPYNVVTAVDGALSAGGGMEYPTITVVSGGGGPDALREVIVHEVGHNWFYGILGSNERDHPWMDEGLNSYYEYRTTDLLRETEMQKNPGVKPKIGAMGIRIPFRGGQSVTEYMRLAVQYAEGNG